MSESKFKTHVKTKIQKVKYLTIRLDWVENLLGKGFSDGVYSLHNFKLDRSTKGFIEMKFLKDWPKNPETIVKLEHFHKEQKAFLYSHGHNTKTGCFMFLKVGLADKAEYLLFDWQRVYDIGTLQRHQMMFKSCGYWEKRINFEELADCLTVK